MCRRVHVHSDLALHLYTICIWWSPALTLWFSLCSTFRSDSEQETSYNTVSPFLFAWIITTWCSYSCCYAITFKVISWKYKLKSVKAGQIMTSPDRFLLHTFCSSTVSCWSFTVGWGESFSGYTLVPQSPQMIHPWRKMMSASEISQVVCFTSPQPTLASSFRKVLAPLCIGASKSL